MAAIRQVLAAPLFALVAAAAGAQPPARVDIYLFWAFGCPHCEREIGFLKRLEAEEPRLRVHYLEVSRDAVNQKAFTAVVERFAPDDPAVPLTVVGDSAMVGYATDQTSGAELRQRIANCLARGCPDTVGPLVRADAGERADAAAARRSEGGARRMIPPVISVPLIGEVRTADFSLPVLTLVLAAIDGFNP